MAAFSMTTNAMDNVHDVLLSEGDSDYNQFETEAQPIAPEKQLATTKDNLRRANEAKTFCVRKAEEYAAEHAQHLAEVTAKFEN